MPGAGWSSSAGISGYDPTPMGFPGGSAYTMVRDVAEGYLLVTERTFKMMTRPELDQLTFEIDRHLRELRGDQPALDDLAGDSAAAAAHAAAQQLPDDGPQLPAKAEDLMTPETLLRGAAVAGALPARGACCWTGCAPQRRLLPPGFRVLWRRVLAGLTVATLLAVGVFAPLGGLGMKTAAPDLDKVTTPQLFLLHVLMLATMGIWFLLGFAGEDARPRLSAGAAPDRPRPTVIERRWSSRPPLPLEVAPPPRGPPRTAVPDAVRLSGAQRPPRDRAGAPARPRRLGRRAAGADGGRRGGLGAVRRERRPQGAAGDDPVHRRAAGPDPVHDQPLGRRRRGELLPRLPAAAHRHLASPRRSSCSPTSPMGSRSC